MFEPGKLKDLVSKPHVHEPFSLGSLIAWLRTKPGDEAYCYQDHGHCLIGQYFKDAGIKHGGIYSDPAYLDEHGKLKSYPIEFNTIAVGMPRTFSAALSRALAAQASV